MPIPGWAQSVRSGWAEGQQWPSWGESCPNPQLQGPPGLLLATGEAAPSSSASRHPLAFTSLAEPGHQGTRSGVESQTLAVHFSTPADQTVGPTVPTTTTTGYCTGSLFVLMDEWQLA